MGAPKYKVGEVVRASERVAKRHGIKSGRLLKVVQTWDGFPFGGRYSYAVRPVNGVLCGESCINEFRYLYSYELRKR